MRAKQRVKDAALWISESFILALVHLSAYIAFVIGCIAGGIRVGWSIGVDVGDE